MGEEVSWKEDWLWSQLGVGWFLLELSSLDLFLPLGLSLRVVLVPVLLVVGPLSELLLTCPHSYSGGYVSIYSSMPSLWSLGLVSSIRVFSTDPFRFLSFDALMTFPIKVANSSRD